MTVLTLNAGSSSLKVALYDGESVLARGLADRIGAEGTLRLRDASGVDLPAAGACADHGAALTALIGGVSRAFPALQVQAVGHRVVHGGPDFAGPCRIDGAVMAAIEALVPFAPLHQPHNVAGIRAATMAFPGAVQVACFDTAFHRGQGRAADTYALPGGMYDQGIRRYGFHGLSYASIARTLDVQFPGLARGRVVVAHLGNGASLCAMQAGRSVATTMGFTALDGVPMGTRSGQIDPGVILHLIRQGQSVDQVEDLLYRRSGLLGLSGLSHDMRTLEASADPAARLAISHFAARVQQGVGAMAAALGGLDALVFTAGIGENARGLRAEIVRGLDFLGLGVDAARNAENSSDISAVTARARTLVILTDEEGEIARATRSLI
jgi:acetate kinase